MTTPNADKKPRVTTTKGVRLTPNEIAVFEQLLPQYPECASEADLLREATLIGMYVLAAQATGQPTYGGYTARELVALLKYRVLPVIDFLFEHDAFPSLYRADNAPARVPVQSNTTEGGSTSIVAEAAADLSDLGVDFI